MESGGRQLPDGRFNFGRGKRDANEMLWRVTQSWGGGKGYEFPRTGVLTVHFQCLWLRC